MESTPWRTPLGELPVDVDRSAELDAICSEVLDGPFDGTQLCTPPGLTPIPTTPPLSQWAFAKFTELVADAGFLAQLEAARKDPKGRVAREVLKKVIGFINLSAKSVPWGTRERAAEMTKLMADHRSEGAGSIFYSVAPDDVHSMDSIRYATPFVGYGSWPQLRVLCALVSRTAPPARPCAVRMTSMTFDP